MADPIQVEITANIQGLLTGLEKGTDGFKQFGRDIDNQTKSISRMIDNLKAPFVALVGVLGGGAFLKSTIDETKAWTVEAQKLAKTLGITTEQASVLNLAIGDIHGTQEEYLSAVAKLTKTLSTNEDAFKKLGVATRDQNGNLRSTPEIMAEVNSRLMEMKSGTDRNVESQRIYGKSWMEVQRYLGLTNEVIAEAQDKAERLNLIVGQDSVQATNAYRASVNGLEDVIKALKLRIGNELMPVITALNNDMAENGPSAVKALCNSFSGLYQMVNAIRESFRKMFEMVVHDLSDTANKFLAFGGMASAVLTGHFGDVKKVWKQYFADVESEARDHALTMKSIEDDYTDPTMSLMGLGPKKNPGPAGTGTGHATSKEAKPKNDGAQAEQDAVLAAVIAAAKQAFQAKKDILEQELAEKKITLAKEIEAEQIAVAEESAMQIMAVNARIETLDKSETGYAAKLAKLQAEKAAIVAQNEHAISDLTIKGTKERQKADEEAAKQREELAKEATRAAKEGSQDEFESRRAALDQDVAMGRMSAQQRLAAEIQLRNAEKALTIQALSDEQALLTAGSLRWQQLENQKLAVSRKTEMDLTKLEDKALQERKQKWDSFFGSMTGGFDASIKGLIKGTMSWGQAFVNVLDQALEGLINLFVQWGTKELLTIMTTSAMHTAASEKKVAENAAEAGSAGMKSAAEIPGYGWLIAIGAGLAIFAAAKGLSSFAVGTDYVPHDMVAQIHQGERIVPAALNWAGGHNDGGAQSPGGDHFHLHAEFMDSRGFERAINNNQSAMVKLFNEMKKNGRR